MIPDQVIEDIRVRVNIVEVISQVVPLKRAGRLFRAPCPFHHEKDPSFTVYADKQIFKCFGCGESGNIFGFVMKYYHMDFPEAARFLGDMAGVEVPTTGGGGSVGLREKLFEINRIAAEFFVKQLESEPEDSPAKKYLHEKRKLDDPIIKKFELGFAPDSWDTLVDALRAQKVDLKLAESLGLVGRGKSGKYYSKFRNRIVFTCRSAADKVVGFSGRNLVNEEPKYFNSADSTVFSKGSVLFGLNFAGREISKKKRAIICEGNFDLVTLHARGYTESLAVFGSALTENHVRILERYTSELYLIFDGDEGGRKALWRSIALFLPSKIHPRVVLLPEGEDPDSFLNSQGEEALDALMESAPLGMDFAIQNKLDEAGEDPEKRTTALGQLTDLVRKIVDPIRKDQYIQRLSDASGISEAAIREKMGQQERPGPAARVKLEAKNAEKKKLGEAQPDAAVVLLVISLINPSLARKAVQDELEEFMPDTPVGKEVARLLTAAGNHPIEADPDPGRYLARVENLELSSRLSGLMLEYEDRDPSYLGRIFSDVSTMLKSAGVDRRIRALETMRQNAKKAKDNRTLLAIAQELADLRRLKAEILEDFYGGD